MLDNGLDTEVYGLCPVDLHVVVVVFFFEYNKSWTSVNSILLRYNAVGIFNCRSYGITEL